MVKNNGHYFPTLLEAALTGMWGESGEELTPTNLTKTRQAISYIRSVYRLKGDNNSPQPSKINFGVKKNRVGYLASYGQRHAYLSYRQLKDVQRLNEDSLPSIGNDSELHITSLGAGACIEIWGILLFYASELRHSNIKIKLLSIDKSEQWVPDRQVVFDRVFKKAFPNTHVTSENVNINLTDKLFIPKLSEKYDTLIKTDILLVYNVLNEIPSPKTLSLLRNIRFLLDNFQKRVLVLLMEPSAQRVEPRVFKLKSLLSSRAIGIQESKETEYFFDAEPTLIEMDKVNHSLNNKLFEKTLNRSTPEFQTSIKRANMACVLNKNSPISVELTEEQIRRLGTPRTRKGQFVKGRIPNDQMTFLETMKL